MLAMGLSECWHQVRLTIAHGVSLPTSWPRLLRVIEPTWHLTISANIGLTSTHNVGRHRRGLHTFLA